MREPGMQFKEIYKVFIVSPVAIDFRWSSWLSVTAMQEKIRFKHRVEYVLLRGLGALVCAVPYRVALWLAWPVAALMHFVFRFRTAEARRRIRLVLGDETDRRRIRRIAWISWRNVCFNAVELMRMARMDRRWIARHMPGLDDTVRGIQQCMGGKGGLLAVPHMGSWDLGGVCCHILGLPLFFIARRQKNPLTDAYLNRLRGVSGVPTVLNDSRVLHSVIRRLKQGEIMAILPDVRARQEALDLAFLGGRANIGGGMGLFARQAKVPILPLYGVREGWTRHRWTLLPPVYPDLAADKRQDWQRMTQEIMDRFDAVIRQHPEQYFWYNKRWILDPLPREGQTLEGTGA